MGLNAIEIGHSLAILDTFEKKNYTVFNHNTRNGTLYDFWTTQNFLKLRKWFLT